MHSTDKHVSDEPTESERAHVPPDPPQHFMGDMSKEHMIELMQMEDDAPFGMALLDQLEWRDQRCGRTGVGTRCMVWR